MSKQRKFDICVVGGCGHVGLPLGMAFADRGRRVVLYDINQSSVDRVNAAEMPFLENNAQPILDRVTSERRLTATVDPRVITESEIIIMVIGTPVDEHLSPRQHDILRAVDEAVVYLDDEQLLVMRSTLYPGTTELVANKLRNRGMELDVSFCPERIAEGHALTELYELPQIVSGCTASAVDRASKLFSYLAPSIIVLEPKEAELAKLIANNTRYLEFAMANQFFIIADSHGLDYARIHAAVTQDYPRLSMLPTPGFAAGPCLFKDTMQLAAFSGGTYMLGHSGMLINEHLPDYVVDRLAAEVDLRQSVVGVLGMAFKANNDDSRESLSYRLKKRLELVAGEVLCTDAHIQNPDFVEVEEIIARADIVILATPHREYANLDLDGKRVVDIWNFYGNGSKI